MDSEGGHGQLQAQVTFVQLDIAEVFVLLGSRRGLGYIAALATHRNVGL